MICVSFFFDLYRNILNEHQCGKNKNAIHEWLVIICD